MTVTECIKGVQGAREYLGNREDLSGETISEMCSKDEWVLIRPRDRNGAPKGKVNVGSLKVRDGMAGSRK